MTVTRRDGVYFVEGEWLLRVMRGVNFDDEEGLQYFERVLRSAGVIDELVKAARRKAIPSACMTWNLILSSNLDRAFLWTVELLLFKTRRGLTRESTTSVTGKSYGYGNAPLPSRRIGLIEGDQARTGKASRSWPFVINGLHTTFFFLKSATP